MADKNLRIQIEALIKGLAGVQALGGSFDKLKQSADGAAGKGGGGGATGLGGALDALNKPIPGVSSAIANLMQANQQAANSFNSLIGFAKAATLALIAYAGVQFGKNAADLAASNETLQNTLYLIGDTAGYTKDELDTYEKALVKVGITTKVARDTMVQFIRAGIDIGPASKNAEARIIELAKAAQNLAKATGQNTSETLQRMLLNIQQLDTVGLRFIGVTVQSEKAFAAYAKTIGKTANELSTTEKQQALMNEVVKQGGQLAGIYEKSLETTGGKLGSLARYQEEASASIGALLLPAYGKLIDAQTQFLKWTQETADALRANGEFAQFLSNAVEAIISTVSRLGAAATKNISALAAPLTNMVQSLQAAFSGFSVGGLLDTVETVIGKVVEWAGAIANAVAENAPLIRILAESFSLVGEAITSIAANFTGLFDGLGEGITLSEILGAAITTVGFVVAGFADGLKLAGAAANVMLAGIGIGFGAVATLLGEIVGVVLPGLGSGLKEVGDRALQFGVRAAESARGTIKDFADGKTAVQGFRNMMDTLPTSYDKVGDASKKSITPTKKVFEDAKEEVRKFAEEVRKGGLTTAQAEQKYNDLHKRLQDLANSGKLTKKEVDQLSQSLNVNKERSSKLDETLKNLGLSASEFATGMSDAGGKASAAFFDLAREGTNSADQLNLAFTKALAFETSLEGLKRYQGALDGVKTIAAQTFNDVKPQVDALRKSYQDGTITLQQYAEGMSALEKKTAGARAQMTEYEAGTKAVKVKFEELFEAQLKSARTDADFKALNNTLIKMGNDGSIAASRVSLGMQQIAEKASGARDQVLRLSSQMVQMAEKNASVSDKGLAVSRSQLDVQRSQMSVQQAQNQYAADGSDLSKAQLEYAQAQQNVSQQQARQTQLDQQTEFAGKELLKAQQDKANADAALERDKSNEQFIRASKAAGEEVDKKTQVVDQTKAASANQKEATNATQATADKAALVVEKQKQVAEETRQTEQATQNWLGGLASIYTQIANTGKIMQDLGYTSQEAQEKQAEVTRTMNGGLNGAIVSMSVFIRQLANALRLQENMVAEANRQKALAEEQLIIYDQAKEKAQKMAQAAAGVRTEMFGAVSNGVIFDRIMASARREAEGLKQAAIDASVGFLRAVSGIRDELLEAQGREDEAAAARFEARKRDLKLEYEILRAKLEGARVTAEAAGISTGGITQALNDLNAGYSQAVRDLDALQKIEEDKRKASKAAAEEAQRKAFFEQSQAKAQGNNPDPGPQAPREENYGADIQANLSELLSMARNEKVYGGGGNSGVEMHQIVRRVEVTLRTNSGSPVTVETNESDESALLRLLEQARGVA